MTTKPETKDQKMREEFDKVFGTDILKQFPDGEILNIALPLKHFISKEIAKAREEDGGGFEDGK